jgi:hypothetical protein
MKNDNNIYQVLVGETIAAKDDALTSLSAGQLGVYDASTAVAIDSTNASTTKDIFLMLNPNNSTNLIKSQGNRINVAKINSITKKAYTAGVSAKITITLPAIGNDASAVIDTMDSPLNIINPNTLLISFSLSPLHIIFTFFFWFYSSKFFSFTYN